MKKPNSPSPFFAIFRHWPPPCYWLNCHWCHATTRLLRRGGGAFLRKGGGGQIFFVRPLLQKLILHHIDTFVMQVSWIGSKQSNEIIIFIITAEMYQQKKTLRIITEMFYSMIDDDILMIELTSDLTSYFTPYDFHGVTHPDNVNGQCLSFLFFRLSLLLVSLSSWVL